jgi:Na+-transporting NADH:ubiquinone oxidoreductase subunit NqrC
MKKFIKVAVSSVLALMLIAGLAVTAFASKTEPVVESVMVLDEEGHVLDIVVTSVKDGERITLEDAAEVIPGVTVAELKEIFQQDIQVESDEDGTTFTFTATLTGLAKGTKLYMVHRSEEKGDELIGEATVENDNEITEIKGTVSDFSPIAIYAQEPVAPTGDSSHVILWGALMVVAAAGAAVLVIFDKKRKA